MLVLFRGFYMRVPSNVKVYSGAKRANLSDRHVKTHMGPWKKRETISLSRNMDLRLLRQSCTVCGKINTNNVWLLCLVILLLLLEDIKIMLSYRLH